ncbi:MAG: hypothetical protein AB2L14_09680 [Candidatus Xenobiia bacterium LiM19]
MADQINGFSAIPGYTQGVGTYPANERVQIREQMTSAAVEGAPVTPPTPEEAASVQSYYNRTLDVIGELRGNNYTMPAQMPQDTEAKGSGSFVPDSVEQYADSDGGSSQTLGLNGDNMLAYNDKPQQSAIEKPISYKENGQFKKTNYGELLNKSSDDLGKMWPKLGSGKYDIYDGLSTDQKSAIEKKLMEYANSQAQNQYNNKDPKTFENYGVNLNQIPRIHAMGDKDKSETLYKQYTGFLDQNNTSFPTWKNPLEWFERGNPVAAVKDGHGRCGEHSKLLKDMFNGAQVSSDTVEAWGSVGKDWNGSYKKDANGMDGHGANHQGVMVQYKDGSGKTQQAVFDPAKYFLEKTNKGNTKDWDHSVTWPEWVKQHHDHGWDGSLNTFVQGDKVIEDYNR